MGSCSVEERLNSVTLNACANGNVIYPRSKAGGVGGNRGKKQRERGVFFLTDQTGLAEGGFRVIR